MRVEDYKYFLKSLQDSEFGDNETIYVYYSHMGGLYIDDTYLELEDLYCEYCGDFDILIEAGIKKDLIEKYSDRMEEEEELKRWFFKNYEMLKDDHGYIKTIKSIIGEDIKLEKDFWIVCPEGQDCYVPPIDSIEEFKRVLEDETPQECKFCALQNLLWSFDN